MARSVSACLSWRDATFFGQHRTSALQLKSSHHKILKYLKATKQTVHEIQVHVLGWLALGQQVRGSSNQAPRHRSWPRLNPEWVPECGCGWAAAAPDPVQSKPIARVLRNHSSRDLSVHGFFRVLSRQTKKRASACENCKAKRSKSADLCTAMHAPVICMTVGDMPVYIQMNRCQGGKSSRLCRRAGSFPVVTVTNLFANRSTLNSCNFVVSWRIELKFVALESWRVSFFNNVSFVAKRWGLKNHPRSLLNKTLCLPSLISQTRHNCTLGACCSYSLCSGMQR